MGRHGVLLALVLAPALISHLVQASSYDYGDDDFWKDPPPKRVNWREAPPDASGRPQVDQKTGQKLMVTTLRFMQARLKPNKERTKADANEVAAELQEAFENRGLTRNKVNAANEHVVTMQVWEPLEEIQDTIFASEAVWDVVDKIGPHPRPGNAVESYEELWVAEFGDSAPVPLKEQLESMNAPPPAPPQAKRKKRRGKGGKKNPGEL